MKIPWWLIVIAIVLGASGITGLIYKSCGDSKILSDVADLALILTLIVLIFYTYFTYALAKEPMLPVAS